MEKNALKFALVGAGLGTYCAIVFRVPARQKWTAHVLVQKVDSDAGSWEVVSSSKTRPSSKTVKISASHIRFYQN